MPVVSESLPLRRVAARTRLDFWFDAAILVGYTVAYSYGFTGVVIHEWSASAFRSTIRSGTGRTRSRRR